MKDEFIAKFKQLLDRFRNSENGQSLIVVAAAAIGLIAFVGIVTDVGLVYVQYGHLRRATDAAAVAAAGQIRAGWSYDHSLTVATQHIKLHNLTPENVRVYVPPISGLTSAYYHDVCCNPANPDPVCLAGFPDPPDTPLAPEAFEDVSLCDSPPRKLVRVEVDAKVDLAFLNVIGLHSVTMSSVSEGEAATLDVALVVDNSFSMVYDTPGYDGSDATYQTAFIDACHATDTCEPMASVREAAQTFVGKLREPFDRVSVVSFDRWARTEITMTNDIASAVTAVENFKPYDEPGCFWALTDRVNDFWLCTANTNLGAGIARANNQFTDPRLRRDESVWVMVILSDGATNFGGGVLVDGNDPCALYECCPPASRLYRGDGGTAPPYCTDEPTTTRHCSETASADCNQAGIPYDLNDWPVGWTHDVNVYDADDFARDMADFAALQPPDGNFITIFSIGMGTAVVSDTNALTFGYEQDSAEKLLRYVANIGYNGQWNGTYVAQDGGTISVNGGTALDPCYNAPRQQDCGNYYWSDADINELNTVFANIASRIFTRITQ